MAIAILTPEPVSTTSWRQPDGNFPQDQNASERTLPTFTLLTPGVLAALSSNNTAGNGGVTLSSAAATLSTPNASSKDLDPETKAALIQALTHEQQGQDIDKIDRAVAGVAAICGSQMVSSAMTTKINDNAKAAAANGPVTVSGSGAPRQARSQPAMEGGTDITAPTETGFRYSNMMGDMGILEAFTSIMKVLNQQEAHFNVSAARWSQTTMASAALTGQNLINAASENRTGAITAGVTSFAMQAGTTTVGYRSLKTEAKSLKTNFGPAAKIDKEMFAAQKAVDESHNPLLTKQGTMSPEINSTMSKSHPEMQFEAAHLRQQHNTITNKSMRQRMVSDAVNQGTRGVHEMIDSNFKVSSAEKSREAEISRANQTVSGEVNNAHVQTAKKASDGESALRQTLLAILNNNNEAVSAIANRMA